MEEKFKAFLEKDEEILWIRKQKKNLLSIISFGIKVGIISFFFCLILILITIFSEMILAIIIITIIFMIIIGWLIWYVNHHINRMKKILELSSKELRQYDFIEIITNKRYIRKSYFFSYFKDLSKYPKNLIEQTGDIIFLNLDSIEKIIIEYKYRRIGLFLKGYKPKFFNDTDFFIEFIDDEFDELIKLLKNTLTLERKEKNPVFEEYFRRN